MIRIITRRPPAGADPGPRAVPAPRRGRRAGRAGASGVAGALAVGLLAGCGGASTPAPRPSAGAGDGMPAAIPGTGRADLGDLHIRGAYIPQEASPDVAAAYFSVTNDGSAAEQLVAVTTPAAPSVGIHTTVTNGGTETMEQLRSLAIPARGTALLSVGGRHLMLMNPVHLLRKGERIALTLRFAQAGAVTMTVPVVGFTGPDDMTGMAGMTGAPSATG